MTLALLFLIGFLGGLRSLTPPAAVAWGAHLGLLKVHGALALIGSLPSVAIFTAAAVAELAVDKWPKTPSRTSIPGLSARILLGALAGACLAVATGDGAWGGAVLGALGGVAGAYAGFHARTRLTRALKVSDYYVAVVEDLVAIVGCLVIVSLV
jgi:uncharacterized membrane protein